LPQKEEVPRQNGTALFGIANYLAKFDQVRMSILARENDVFFCPGVDLAAVWAVEFAALDFCGSPQFFPDCLAARRQFRG